MTDGEGKETGQSAAEPLRLLWLKLLKLCAKRIAQQLVEEAKAIPREPNCASSSPRS